MFKNQMMRLTTKVNKQDIHDIDEEYGQKHQGRA